MARIIALVEGPTERNFGQKILAPYFGLRGIAFHPRVIGKPGHKGRVGAWEKARREILALIKQEATSTITTMFDLYALPQSWPGRRDALERSLKNAQAVQFIEAAISSELAAAFSAADWKMRFVPYLSLHEFEALLFSDPEKLASVTQDPRHAQQFREIVEQCGECERINDHPSTAPSKRILKFAPGYVKTVDGITAAVRIGIAAMRQKCPHFNDWIVRLESASS